MKKISVGDFLDFTSDLMDGTIFGTDEEEASDQAVAQTAYYGNQQPYGQPAYGYGYGYGQSSYYYMNPSSGTSYPVRGQIDPSANMGCGKKNFQHVNITFNHSEARFVDIHDGKRRYLCNCGALGYSYQYYYCGRMQG